MNEKDMFEGHKIPQQQPKLLDLSTELYEGGKADVTKIGEYVEVARKKGITDAERLDLTGGTMMPIYIAVSAEAGRPDSKVREFAFNNPAREGRVVLWSEEMSASAPEKPTRSLIRKDMPPSLVDPQAPEEVLDVRLLYAEDPEAIQQMADSKKAEEYMKEIIAQIREYTKEGKTTVRITGIPMWAIQGTAFIGAREGAKRIIFWTLNNESILYDVEDRTLVGKGVEQIKKAENVEVDLTNIELKDEKLIETGRKTETILGKEIRRNNVDLKNLDLDKVPSHIALRMFDSIHSFSSSLKLSGIEIFQHLDPRTHDLVPKTKERNPELLPKEQRIPITLDVHVALEKNENDIERTILELAKEAVNKANKLTFSGINNELELAIAGKVAHAAHGLIEELSYQNKEKEEIVKSWKVE